MRRGIRAVVWAAGAITLPGCPADSELAELRLFPCLVDGTEPSSLRVQVQPRDGAGLPLGEPKTGVYAVEQSVFGDGYATLGYRPVDGSATIDVQVWWYASAQAGSVDEADATSTYSGLPAPSAGQVVELGSETCDGVASTDGTTTVDPTDTESTTSTTTDGTDTTTTVGVTDSTTTMGSATSMGTTTEMGSTTDITTGTTGGENTLEGQPCGMVGDFYCEPLSTGGGKLLECMVGGTWELDDNSVCPSVCSGFFPMQPNFIGCAGEAATWVCLCQANTPAACVPANNECTSNEILTLCVDGEEAVARCAAGDCSYTDPNNYTCSI